ncbi:MAG: hypothetical protein ACFCUJ_07185 [Thiotrichales bacterium]
MTIGLLSGLFGGNSCGCAGQTQRSGNQSNTGTHSSNSGSASRFGDLMKGGAGPGASGSGNSIHGQGGAASGAVSNLAQRQADSIDTQGGSRGHASQSQSMGSQGGSSGVLGGLLGAKANLLGGLLGGGSGSSGGASGNGARGACTSGESSGAGSAAGNFFKGVHATAEKAIDAAGLQSAFAPIDAAVVHPLLWDPLSAATGTDVSDHPEGIKDVGYDR